MQYAIFTAVKNDKFQLKKMMMFQNIDFGYTSEQQVPTIYVLEQNKKYNVYPCTPEFYYNYKSGVQSGYKQIDALS